MVELGLEEEQELAGEAEEGEQLREEEEAV